jgi:hypothetical protein
MIIKEEGYLPVECDEPLPCPFCGGDAKLVQLAHITRFETTGKGRSRKCKEVRICILASNYERTGDTFWFKCANCKCTTGSHKDTAQEAAESWNLRTSV